MEIELAGWKIGAGQPCFIIAEAGVNHNGDTELAKRLVDVAVRAGANAVKFQTFKAERLVARDVPKADYQKETTDPFESQFAMLKKLELSPEAHRELQTYCRNCGILFLSTPFDEESADFLESLDVPVFKIGSGEITNLPLLEYVAKKGKPIILSTGMSYLSEVDEAVRVIRSAGNDQIVLLHCVSNYPADSADANLRAMQTMAAAFGLTVGYSDHTLGIEVAIAAAALGASVIEKHLTLDRSLPGPDHRTSLPPDEFAAMIRGIRKIEIALGDGHKRPVALEQDLRGIARRSLVAACDIPAGVRIERRMVTAKRPGIGLTPHLLVWVVGRKARRPISSGELFDWEMLS